MDNSGDSLYRFVFFTFSSARHYFTFPWPISRTMTHHEQFEKHDHHESSKTCRVCTSTYSHDSHPSVLGICGKCGYKILIILFIVMIAISYVAWFGVLWLFFRTFFLNLSEESKTIGGFISALISAFFTLKKSGRYRIFVQNFSDSGCIKPVISG